MKKIFFILFFVICLCAREEDIAHIYKGNLALPTSQEPAPLFCFGQSVVDQSDLQIFSYINSLLGKKSDFTQVIPNMMYGITDKLTLTLGQPIAAKFKFQNFQSSGVGDFFIQGEYALYNKDRPTYANQATLVAQVTFPSGSLKKNPPTGYGSPTFFLGATACHMNTDWYIFAGVAGLLTTPHASKQLPNTIFYQWGFGKNLYYIPKKMVITLTAEFFGAYTNGSRIRGANFKNFDDNNFFVGPSLWFATERFIFNPGIAFSLYSNKKDPSISRIVVSLQTGFKFNT